MASCPLAAPAQELGPGADRFEVAAPADPDLYTVLDFPDRPAQDDEIDVRRDMVVAFAILGVLAAGILLLVLTIDGGMTAGPELPPAFDWQVPEPHAVPGFWRTTDR